MRVALLMPVRDVPEAATRHALAHHTDGAEVELLTARGLPVTEARTTLWRRAAALRPTPELVVWADADAFWLRGTFDAAASRLARLGERVLLGSFHGKRRPYSDLNAYQVAGGAVRAVPIAEAKAAPDGLTPAFFVGAHFWAHAAALFGLLGDDPFAIGQHTVGEDDAFCRRVIRAGGNVLLDARLPVFHVEGESGFLPGRPRFVYRDGGMLATSEPPPATPQPLTRRRYGGDHDAMQRRFGNAPETD